MLRRLLTFKCRLFILFLLLISIVFICRNNLSSSPVLSLAHPPSLRFVPVYPNATESSRLWVIAKAIPLYGQNNRIYEKALESHVEHNKLHGYAMHVLRAPVAKGFTNKLLWLQHLISTEIQKPEKGRVDWIMYVDPSTILLNPTVPLHVFLPPAAGGFDAVDIIATKPDGITVSSSVFFIRVSSASLAILAKTIVVPLLLPGRHWNGDIASQALQSALDVPEHGDSVVFQPIDWYNSPFAAGSGTNKERLLARFPAELRGRRWKLMHDALETLRGQRLRSVKATDLSKYEDETRRFWEGLKAQREGTGDV